ncbi:MAG: hypothetical protein ACEY3D_00895 [Rickettsia sp.]|uniref:hypothetical protein n=1 Tax=Rickettsia sp. TaxID=789 RepID=UPI00397A95CC
MPCYLTCTKLKNFPVPCNTLSYFVKHLFISFHNLYCIQSVIPWLDHGISGRNLWHKIPWSSHGMTVVV